MKRLQAPKGRFCNGCPRHAQMRCTHSGTDVTSPFDVLVIGDHPSETSATANSPFTGHAGKIITTAIKQLRTASMYSGIQCRYTYAVQCSEEEDTNPTKVELAHCATYLASSILATNPKVIIALGAAVMRQLGLKGKHKDARGRFFTHPKYAAPILVTFSRKALLAKPGLFETFKLDLKNAFDRVLGGEPKPITLETLSAKYLLPKTIDEAIAVCDLIVNYSTAGKPDVHAISVDTETTTLHPEKKGAKIIGFCFGWGKRFATTILYEHPYAPPEYLDRLPELRVAIARVLESRKPKLFHGAKFDLKFIENKAKFVVNNVAWCTLLGEHLLDEDKKGSYGLKVLTAGWLTEYCGYEDKLHDLLALQAGVSQVEAADKEIRDQAEALQEDYPEYLENLKDYRDKLVVHTEQQEQYVQATESYFIALGEYNFVKAYLAGQQAAWKAEVADWPKGKRGKPKKPVRWFRKPKKPKVLKKLKRPKDPRTKKERQISTDAGFEKVPIHDLQVYGAIDADVTRRMASIQRNRIKKEGSKVAQLMRTHAIPASRVLGRMEFQGTKVDREYVEVLDAGLRKIAVATEAELYQMTGTTKSDGSPLNLNHAGTLANVLFNWGWTHPDGTKMGAYPEVGRTKKGAYSTAAGLLRPLVAYQDAEKTLPTKYSYFIERLLRWRKSSKALNTFISNTRVLSKRDGYLHTQFHLNGTGTGRLSCVAESTVLSTNYGPIKISDVRLQSLPTLKVLTHRGRWMPVSKVFKKGKEHMFRVTTVTGEVLDCTMDHRFKTPQGWQYLRELQVTDEIKRYNVPNENPETVAVVCDTPRMAQDIRFSNTRIASIEYLGVQDVWDLTVPVDASYVAQGLVNHNSSDMNMQNLPYYLAGWNIKKMFIPDSDEFVIVNVDYKGAEVRVFTAYAHDVNLINALRNGMDMHSYFAHKVFGRPYAQYAARNDPQLEAERTRIKRVVFGILYGAGPMKISESIGVSFDEARALIAMLYEMFPAIKRYAELIEYEVITNGYVETHFHRRRRFPLSKVSRHRSRAVRQARNFKIQSTSSDIVISQLIEIDEPLCNQFPGARLLLTVHDSMVFQFPKSHILQLKEFVLYYAEQRVAEKFPWLPVPFKVDIEVGPSYGECMDIDKYIAKHNFMPQQEGIVEENELLTELREHAFVAA